MEAQQLKFAQETSQLTGELDSLHKKLAEAEKAAAEEISKQTSRAKIAQDTVAAHMIEMSVFHNSVLCKLFLTPHLCHQFISLSQTDIFVF